MTTQLGVAYATDADQSGAIGQVIASLPVSLHPATADPDLVGVNGAQGWSAAALAAVESGVRGLVIINPVDEDAATLREKADAAGVPIVVDGVWTYNPAVARSADAFRAADDAEALLEVRADVPSTSDLERALLGQLALVRALASPVVDLTVVRWNEHGYDVLASLTSGARASLAAIVTDALPHAVHVRSLKTTTAVELTVPAPASAAPGKAVVSGPDGATLLVTAYESAHRAAWRHLHELVQAKRSCEDLAHFAADTAVARRAHLGS
jgi:hypothetical protein